MRVSVVLAMVLAVPAAWSQWTMQESGVTASLRGIENVGGGVAWASGSGGTVLRTLDGGKVWQKCVVPPGAAKLDFRGVQAFDAKTAVVMSSGTGDASRIYKTLDGCKSWKLVLTNPDKEGFFDGIRFVDRKEGYLVGDPVGGEWREFHTEDGGVHWRLEEEVKGNGSGQGQPPQPLFAASNSSIAFERDQHLPDRWVAAGGKNGGVVYVGNLPCGMGMMAEERDHCRYSRVWTMSTVFPPEGEGAGVFSLGLRRDKEGLVIVVAVGGNYEKPNSTENTAAYCTDDKQNPVPIWHLAKTAPNGYRSAVAFDARGRFWITVGPNGTDVSLDDGRNWTALKPGPGDVAGADLWWNALSLPFVVGSRGRIGILRDGVVATK